MRGLLGVSFRALRASLRGNEALAGAAVAVLDDGQLSILVDGARVLLKAAEGELAGRRATAAEQQ